MLVRRKLRAYVEQHEGDEIRLRIPATADAVRIARVGAAGLGTRLGFSFSEVEELRLAVGEAAALLADESAGHMLRITYDIQPDGLRVTLALEAADGRWTPLPNIPLLTTSVLDKVVNAWEISDDHTEVRLFKIPADRARRADRHS